MKAKNKKAFTLIELLIVIAIIGILSSIVLVNLNSARVKARDAARLSSIKSIQNALDAYFVANEHYPRSINCGSTSPNASWCNSSSVDGNGHWIKDNGVGVISSWNDPVDPGQSASPKWLPSGGGTYFYYGSGSFYMIVFGLENKANSIENQDGAITCQGVLYDYGNSNTDGVITVGGCFK